MTIMLRAFDLAAIAALMDEPDRLDDLVVAEGALPPGFVFETATRALLAGGPPLWCTLYAFVHVESRAIVGTGGFKGLPVDGEIEIGYNVAPSRRRAGYATQGVEALVALAFAHRQRRVTAETSIRNLASRRVVEKAAFERLGQRMTDEDGWVDCWRRDASA